MARLSGDELAFERGKQHAARVFLAATAGMLIIAAIVAYVVYQNRPPTETPHEAASPGRSVRPAVPAPAPGLSTAAQPAGAAAAAPATADRAGAMRLDLHATSACRVDAQVDGHRAIDRVLQPGERVTLTVHEIAVLRLGDAGALELTIDGRPGRALGRRGEAATARITRATMADFLR